MFIATHKINHVKMCSLMALMELKFHFCFSMNIVFCISNSNHGTHACICLQKSVFKNYWYIFYNVDSGYFKLLSLVLLVKFYLSITQLLMETDSWKNILVIRKVISYQAVYNSWRFQRRWIYIYIFFNCIHLYFYY